jgi:putative copper export protein
VEPLFYFQYAFGWKFRGLFFAVQVVLSGNMNWSQLTNGVKQIWETRPGVVVLLALGFVVFVIIVLDARRQRQKHKNKHPKKY